MTLKNSNLEDKYIWATARQDLTLFGSYWWCGLYRGKNKRYSFW